MFENVPERLTNYLRSAAAPDGLPGRARPGGGRDGMSAAAATWVRPLLLAILLVGLALLCLMILAPFIAPIVWAAILAYASWPLYRRLRRMLVLRLPFRLCPGSPPAGSRLEKRSAAFPSAQRRGASWSDIPRETC